MTPYREYIMSQEWRRRRRAYLVAHDQCERCGISNGEHKRIYDLGLNVHHRSYARIGAELDSDLEALCRPCHEKEEGIYQGECGQEMLNSAFEIADNSPQKHTGFEPHITTENAARRMRMCEWLFEFCAAASDSIPQELQKKLLAHYKLAGTVVAMQEAQDESWETGRT